MTAWAAAPGRSWAGSRLHVVDVVRPLGYGRHS